MVARTPVTTRATMPDTTQLTTRVMTLAHRHAYPRETVTMAGRRTAAPARRTTGLAVSPTAAKVRCRRAVRARRSEESVALPAAAPAWRGAAAPASRAMGTAASATATR